MIQTSDKTANTLPCPQEVDVFNNSQAREAIIDLISGVAPFSDGHFFAALAQHISRILGIQYVIVAEVSEWDPVTTSPLTVKTVSFWNQDTIGENFEYVLEETPCNSIFSQKTIEENQGLYCIPSKLEKRFPNAIGKGCFLGSALLEPETQKPIGHMCFMDDRPMVDENLSKYIFKFASSWVATQLQQYRLKQKLQISEACERQKTQQLAQTLEQLQKTHLTLMRTEKMASLGSLVAGVAHEINNPVGCILGNVHAAQEYIGDLMELLDLYAEQFPEPGSELEDKLEDVNLEYVREDLTQLIRAVENSGDRIKAVSKSLCTFSRADKDTKQAFDIHRGLESTVLILRYRLKGNEHRPAIEVVTEYGEIPEINCFPGQLNQVFMNILANAIDALDDASQHRSFADMRVYPHRITIRTSLDHHQENHQVKITIADNGPGIPEDIKTRIFDYLFTTKRVGKGTGLGLAITQQIVVDSHGGSLDVQSEVGQGTEFHIYLPIH